MASALIGKRVAKVKEVAWILHKDPVNSQLCTQFFAVTDEECWHAFGVEPKEGKPDDHEYDEEVVCTSYYSQFEPTENGEVHIRRVEMATARSMLRLDSLDIFTKAIQYFVEL